MNDFESDLLGKSSQEDDNWISVSDLMGAVMVVFLILAIYFMIKVQIEKEDMQVEVDALRAAVVESGKTADLVVEQQQLMTEHDELKQQSKVLKQTVESLRRELRGAQINADSVKEVAVLYDEKRKELYHELLREFESDLPKWNAEIHEDLTIRFNEPNVLFATGSSTIRSEFKGILDDFFPRYLRTVTQNKFRSDIAELRIEGHTSSFWNLRNPEPEQVAYLKNMDLSHQRTRSVLHYVMGLDTVNEDLPWMRKHLTANGLSYAKRIFNEDGTENFALSQRVEFRVRTDVESKLAKILEIGSS